MMKNRCDEFDKIPSWCHFDAVDMGFLDTAAVKFVVEVATTLSRKVVWESFTNPDTWQHWFPKVECVIYSGITPYGAGTTRRSVVDGVFYDETMLVWEEPQRWGYRINKATKAMASAQLEMTELLVTESGTMVRWILACDPLHEINKPGFGIFLENLLKEAMAGLEKFHALENRT